jgi:peptidoglycan-N-acetylglucosamine deacetylase
MLVKIWLELWDALGLESLQRIGVTPKGYRSPGWDLSPNSVGLLLEYGFVYDSSMMGADYQA